MTGGGANMWAKADAFQFVWKRISGDVTITADVRFLGAGAVEHRKAVLLVRQKLDADSAYADAALHGSGLTALQFRPSAGAMTEEVRSEVTAPDRIRIVRSGNQFTMFAAKAGEDWKPAGPVTVALADPVYVGLGVCSHDANVLETAIFSHVTIAQLKVETPAGQAVEKRVEDLLARMTLEEKASQMLSESSGIARLGIPAYNWWNECLHGVARAGVATVFPEPIGMAASWDAGLMFRIATAISDEARAKHQEFVRRGKRGIYQGLTFWTPNINLFRDPRWGRGMETYGEDPYLSGRLAVEFIRGMQGDDPRYLKTIATAKHYAVHSGPEPTRHVFDARVSERDLRETYLPQFEAAVRQGGARSVMCAYNSVDGAPACANTMLLGDILRRQWGFAGYVVSDCGAIGDIYRTHKAAPDAVEGVAMAVKAGTDLDCGMEYKNIVPAVRQGLLAEADVDRAVRRLLTVRFELGMFDPPETVRWTKIPYEVNDSPAHSELALEAARKSIVLLKNEGGALPLRRDLKTITVIGPNADSVESLLGNYNGEPSHPVTPLSGIRRKVGNGMRVLYARGCDVAEGMPTFETVPPSALFTGERGPNGLTGEYFNTAAMPPRAVRTRCLRA